jgi:hypothetical protein
MFLGLLDQDPLVRSIRSRIHICIYIHYCFVTFLDFLSLKNDVNVPSKSNMQKIFFKLVFVGVLKVNDENSRIRIRIH